MDDDFEPRLGRMVRDSRFISQVVRATRRAGQRNVGGKRRFDGSRIGRGAARARVLASGDRHAPFRSRRVIVKTRLVRMVGKGAGAASAHLRYIERDGVTREGAAGQLYARDSDRADGDAFQARCQGDRHQFRFIVSAEDGDQYENLKPMVRRLMTQMEEDLGTRLDWVAVDHFNTGHPHTHIVLRGVDDRGENLVIAREYISHGLREQASRIVTMDLGPRTDLEIEARLRHDVDAERWTPLDRQLLRSMDGDRVVKLGGQDAADQALRTGRVHKLAALGLAQDLGRGRWQLAPDIEPVLRSMGERSDIIRTLQRELASRIPTRAVADQIVFDPQQAGPPLVGRVVTRGLADELDDRHYLIVDGIDGRGHYVAIGKGAAVERLPPGAVIQVTPRDVGIRAVDRTVTDVAGANGGVYTVEAHLRHDPSASEAFAQTHVRRLEALRRARSAEREADGSWTIPADHLDRVAAFERRQQRDQPVHIDVLSHVPVDRLVTLDAATWLDRELASEGRRPIRDAGFGREVQTALGARRQWLIDLDLAEAHEGGVRFRPDLVDLLRRRELLCVAAELKGEVGKPYSEAKLGDRIDGRLDRAVDLTSGRHALIERSHDFTLVPWRDVLERRVGQGVAGIVREGGINWQFGRERGGPTMS